MRNLVSIRMRASRKSGVERETACDRKEIHISGAEGLYVRSEIQKIVKGYLERAMNHPKGRADKVAIVIEEINREPKPVSPLPVATIDCRTPREAKRTSVRLLQSLGISGKAIDAAFGLIRKGGMRGAAIVAGETGDRLEPDLERGVRVSRLGIEKEASVQFSRRLSRYRINTDTVKEALVLASKVISHGAVIAELCVSDDPDYTTGYVASETFGYLRVPNIKHKGSRSGGRAFFVKEGVDVEEMVRYLERTPVLVQKAPLCRGTASTDGILNSPHK
jgi:6-carboxyhexanoate--CoA ligase